MKGQAHVNGTQLCWLEEGDGPLVLLLHGFPDTAHTWDRTRGVLAEAGYRAVSPFLRGYPPSALEGPYDTDTLGRDALALLAHLSDEPAIVVGHDWGASAAYSAAALGPERVDRLITLAIPHPATLRPAPRKLWGARHFVLFQLPGAERRFARDDFRGIDLCVERWSPTWRDYRASFDETRAAFRVPGALRAALAYYRTLGVRPAPSHLLRIAVPTTVFYGRDDGVATRDDFEHAARMFTAGYELVETGGGHFLHLEDPDVFHEELLRCLGEGDSSP